MRHLVTTFILAIFLSTPVFSAEMREVLFQISLDMNADGKPDRAALVLVGPGRDLNWDLTRGHYPLTANETVDLAIYLSAAEGPLDLAKPPTVLKRDIINKERTIWVASLEVVNSHSLKMTANYRPGSTLDLQESLIIAFRKNQFLVVGYETFWENPGGIGNCQLNLSTGKGMKAEGEFPAPAPNFKTKVKPIPLAKWAEKTRPKQCDQPDS